MRRIVKPLSLLLAIVLLAGMFGACLSASAAPATVTPVRRGRTLVEYMAFFSKKPNLSLAQYNKSGTLLTLPQNKAIDILGKDKSGGDYFYIRFYYKTAYVYGYILRSCAYVENRYHYKGGTMTAVNPYYGRKEKHDYRIYKSMPFYQYDQTGQSGIINGLRISYSCGAQTVATVLSALEGSPIFPEEIMDEMPTYAINGAGFGSNISIIVPGVKNYIRSRHNLAFDYKCIKPEQSFSYLKKGYIVILGLENKDGLSLFTNWSHYIVLAGYDNMGNVITVNSNLKTSLFDSFSVARIQKNMVNSYFYNTNTIAFKYSYNDSYSAFKKPYLTTTYQKCTVSQHYGAKGKLYHLKAGKKINVLGERGDTYYIQFYSGAVKRYGFIAKSKVIDPVTITANSTAFVCSGTKKAPIVSFKTNQGKVLKAKYYTLTYPKQTVEPGSYTLKIRYTGRYRGPATLKYKILPKGTAITAAEAGESALRVSWQGSSNPKTISGYELQYATDSAFKSAQTLRCAPDQTQCLIEDIDTTEPYYWRIRTYKETGGKTYYSAWSSAYESEAFVSDK